MILQEVIVDVDVIIIVVGFKLFVVVFVVEEVEMVDEIKRIYEVDENFILVLL